MRGSSIRGKPLPLGKAVASILIVDPWLPEDFTIPLEGKSQELEAYNLFNETVPVDCMSGKYTLLLELIDEEGKVTLQAIDIDIL